MNICLCCNTFTSVRGSFVPPSLSCPPIHWLACMRISWFYSIIQMTLNPHQSPPYPLWSPQSSLPLSLWDQGLSFRSTVNRFSLHFINVCVALMHIFHYERWAISLDSQTLMHTFYYKSCDGSEGVGPIVRAVFERDSHVLNSKTYIQQGPPIATTFIVDFWL